MIIGANILNSPAKTGETNTCISFATDSGHTESPIVTLNDLYIDEPISIQPGETKTVEVNNPLTATSVIVQSHFSDFEYHTQSGSLKIPIWLTNKTEMAFTIPPYTCLGTVQPLTPTEPTHYLETDNAIYLVTYVTVEDKINDSSVLTPAEKQSSLKNFNESGVFQDTVTDFTTTSKMETILTPDTAIKTLDELINEVNLKHLPPHRQHQIRQILHNNGACFARSELDTGTIPEELLLATLPQKDNAPTERAQRFIPVNPNIKDRVQNILQQYEHQDIIEPASKPPKFISNLLIITKRDKDTLRVLCDLRLANLASQNLATAQLPIWDISYQMMDNPYRSSFDLSNSFFQITVDPEDRPTLCFYDTNKRLYWWKKLPQGHKQSPYWLNALTSIITKDISFVTTYADDILIHAPTEQDHDHTLNALLERLVQLNITIKPKKITILPKEIDFIGYTFKNNVFSIPRAKIEAFLAMQAPNTRRQAKGLIAAFSFYRRWIPDFAGITDNIRKTTLDNKRFKWTPEADREFKQLKKLVQEQADLMIVDYNKPMICHSDGSKSSVSFALSQTHDGHEKPCVFVSRALTLSERNYSPNKLEALAISYGLKALHPYLFYAQQGITLYTDCRSLLYLAQCQATNPHLARLAQAIAAYDLTVIHIAGENNKFADFFSRMGIQREQALRSHDLFTPQMSDWLINKLHIRDGYILTQDELQQLLTAGGIAPPEKPVKRPRKTPSRETTVKQSTPPLVPPRKVKVPWSRAINEQERLHLHSLENARQQEILFRDGTLTTTDFQDAQALDNTCISLAANINESSPFLIHQGLLCKKGNPPKPVIPLTFLHYLIHILHYSNHGLHSPHTKISKRIEQSYYHPKLATIAKQQLIDCYFCRKNTQPKLLKPIINDNIRADYPLHVVGVDFLGILPASQGCKLIFVIIDHFTLHTVIYATTGKHVKAVQNCLNMYLRHMGRPHILRSDEEASIMSKEIQEFLQFHHIAHCPSAPHSPNSNGIAELRVATIKRFIRTNLEQNKNWPDLLTDITIAINTTPTAFGPTPKQLLHGDNGPSPINLICNTHTSDHYEELTASLKKIRDDYKLARETQRNATKAYANRSRRIIRFNTGDLVTRLTDKTIKPAITTPLSSGPFRIVEFVSPNTVALRHLVDNSHARSHINFLVPYTPPLPEHHGSTVQSRSEKSLGQ